MAQEINFEYEFLVEKDYFKNAKEIDIPLLLFVEADFKIFINNELYFEEPIAIFEFYYVLFKWKLGNVGKEIKSFNYYSIDYDESVYVDGAVISLLSFETTAQVKTIWEKHQLDTTFDLNYAVEKFYKLEEELRNDLEQFFTINLFELFEKAAY